MFPENEPYLKVVQLRLLVKQSQNIHVKLDTL